MRAKSWIVNLALIILGILSAGLGFKSFLVPSHFVNGGVSGISMLLAETTHLPLSVVIFVVNLPFIYLAYRRLGFYFAIRSALAIAVLSLCIAFVAFPEITHDKSLTAVFGGFFIGMGIGLAIRSGAVLDGTEIAALLVSKRMQLFKVSDVILVLNVIIFSGTVLFLGYEVALYSILTYVSASKTVDFILNGIEQYTSITVVSGKGEAIRKAITDMGRGVTVYEGKKGYGKDGHINEVRDIIFTVATRLEIPSIKAKILDIDPSAFIVQQSIEDTSGGLLKRKEHH